MIPGQSRFKLTQQLINTLYDHMAGFGYEPIETTVIESADLFLTRAGDQLVNKLFTFERYGLQLALRPEFTAAAAYKYAHENHSGIARWQFYGTVFEDDPDDYRHNYQRLSMGAELIGLSGAAADAEIMCMAAQGLKNLGSWQLKIGHIGLMRRLLSHFKLDSRTERFLINRINWIKDPAKGKEYVLDRYDHALLGNTAPFEELVPEADPQANNLTEINTQHMLDALLDATQRGMTMGGRTRHDIARRLLQKRQRMSERQQVVDAVDFLMRWCQLQLSPSDAFDEIQKFVSQEEQPLLDEWQETINILIACDVDPAQITIKPDLARNWDYYTGVVFEIQGTNSTRFAGGGRYDELVSLLANQQTVPAVGFAYYINDVLDHSTDGTQRNPAPVRIIIDANNQSNASKLAHLLRQQTITTITTPEIASGSLHLHVDAQGNISFNASDKKYSLEHTDTLITDVKRAYYDQSHNNRTSK